jgi:ankyrin repeat protein
MEGGSPLHDSAWNGHLESCAYLLAHGADCNRVDNEQRTALHYAARRGFPNIVQLLIHKGANVNAITADHFTPLVPVITCMSYQLTWLLIAHGM